jgi:hypothetical protein
MAFRFVADHINADATTQPHAAMRMIGINIV